MKFFYGSFVHPDAEVQIISFRQSYIRGATNRIDRLVVDMECRGKIINQSGDVQATMAMLGQRQLAYSIDGMSAGMLDNNGNRIQELFLDSSAAVGGVIVTNPVSTSVKAAEGVTYLWYTFGLHAEFPVASTLLSFQETLSFSDINGAPLQVERVPINGPPLLQDVTSQSWFYATQSGSLTQNSANPQPNAMIFPNNLRGQDGAKSIVYSPVKVIRGTPVEWGVSWSYSYISPVPLFGQPTVLG